MSGLCQRRLSFGHFIIKTSSKSIRFSPIFSVLLITLSSSNFFLRKYFLDRKKVLKSLEANSFIYRGNVGPPHRYQIEQPPNVQAGKTKNHLHHPSIGGLS